MTRLPPLSMRLTDTTVKVTIHSRGSTSTRAAAKAGVDLIYHADLATQADLDIIAKAGIPIAPVLTSPQRQHTAYTRWTVG